MRTLVTVPVARALVAAVAVPLAGLLVVGLAAPAQAGGPTSVLLVVPGGGGTAALYYDDPDYAELARLVGADSGSAPAGDTTGGGHETESAVTVTWLIHDVQVWRVDRIYLGGPDGPWVASQVQFDRNIWDAPVSWHRPAEPKALLALLERLGLDPTGGDGGIPLTDGQPAPEPSPAARDAAPAPQQETPAPGGGMPWLLLTVASVAGALVAVAVTLPLARRTHDRATAAAGSTPAYDHVAAGTNDVDADDAAAWSPTEELWSRR